MAVTGLVTVTSVVGRVVASARGRRLLVDALGVLVLNVVTVCLNFATALVLARLLGVAQFGAYAFAVAWAMLLAVPGGLGIPPLVVRTVAFAHVHAEWGRMRGMVRRANQAVLVASAVTVVLAASLGWLFLGSDNDLAIPSLIGLALVPLVGLTSVRQSAMQGLSRVVLGRAPETLVAPALFLIAVVCAYVASGERLRAPLTVGLQVLAAAIAFLVGALLLKRVFPAEARQARAASETRAWLRSVLPLAFLAGVGVLNAQIGVVLVGFMLGPAETGTYAVAARAALVISFLFMTARYAVGPAVARLHALDDRDRMQRLVTRSGQAIFILTVPVAVAVLVFADSILALFGSGFEEGATALRILCIGEIVAVATGFAQSVLLMTGHELPMSKAVAAGSLVNVVLSPVLIALWGVPGAAAAAAAGVAAVNAGAALVAWRSVRIYSPAIGFPRAIR